MKNQKNQIKFLHDCLLVENILVIGDLHIGYNEYICGGAVFPYLREIIEKLDEIFRYLIKESIRVEKIVLLGDVKHDFGKIADSEWREALEFFDYLENKLDENENKLGIMRSDKINQKYINLDSEKSGFNPTCFNSEIKNPDFFVCKELKTPGILTSNSLYLKKNRVNKKWGKISEINKKKEGKNSRYDKNSIKGKRIIVIRGNHDNFLGPIVKKRDVKLVDYYFIKTDKNNYYKKNGRKISKICFLHGNRLFKQCLDSQTTVLIFGHLHPSITLFDRYKSERYKCFLKGGWKINDVNKTVYILPSFSNSSYGYDLANLGLTSSLKKTRIGNKKEMFFVVPDGVLKRFEVIIYNNKEKKEYNFGKLEGLIEG